MGQVTIQTLGHFSTYGDSPKGDYLVTIQGDDRELLLFHDTSSKYEPPKVGDQFDGEVKPGKRPGTWRLSRVRGGGSTSSTGGGGYQKTPDQQRSIVRQHSQEMALRFIAATGDASELNLSDGEVVRLYLNQTVKRLTDWFAKDAGGSEPAPAQQNGAPQEVPADTTDFQPAPTPASASDQSIPF